MKKSILFLFFSFFFLGIKSQNTAITDSLYNENKVLIQTEKGLFYEIPLPEVSVYKPLTFSNEEIRKKYYRLKKRVFKVYPYAKLSAERLQILNERIANVKSKRKKKQYIKRLQKYTYEEFAPTLKKFYYSDAKILIRLIHRQIGITAFDLLKEYRSGWVAFWWQRLAGLFDISLKGEFRPMDDYEDFLIEDILQRAFDLEELERRPAVKQPPLDSIYKKWESSEEALEMLFLKDKKKKK